MVSDVKPQAWRLTGDLNIQSAAQQLELLREGLAAASEDVALDLADIEGFDSAGVQLLLSSRRCLADRGLSLSLRNVPAGVSEVLSTYGLGDALPTSS